MTTKWLDDSHITKSCTKNRTFLTKKFRISFAFRLGCGKAIKFSVGIQVEKPSFHPCAN
jgi:hypothetical protein